MFMKNIDRRGSEPFSVQYRQSKNWKNNELNQTASPLQSSFLSFSRITHVDSQNISREPIKRELVGTKFDSKIKSGINIIPSNPFDRRGRNTLNHGTSPRGDSYFIHKPTSNLSRKHVFKKDNTREPKLNVTKAQRMSMSISNNIMNTTKTENLDSRNISTVNSHSSFHEKNQTPLKKNESYNIYGGEIPSETLDEKDICINRLRKNKLNASIMKYNNDEYNFLDNSIPEEKGAMSIPRSGTSLNNSEASEYSTKYLVSKPRPKKTKPESSYLLNKYSNRLMNFTSKENNYFGDNNVTKNTNKSFISNSDVNTKSNPAGKFKNLTEIDQKNALFSIYSKRKIFNKANSNNNGTNLEKSLNYKPASIPGLSERITKKKSPNIQAVTDEVSKIKENIQKKFENNQRGTLKTHLQNNRTQKLKSNHNITGLFDVFRKNHNKPDGLEQTKLEKTDDVQENCFMCFPMFS